MSSKIEELRSAFRIKHKELLNHCPREQAEKLEKEFASIVDQVKKYLRDLKSKRKTIREKEDNCKAKLTQDKENKVKFINEEVRRIITSLSEVFSGDVLSKSDEEVTKLKSELSTHLKLFLSLPKKIEELMENGE